MHNTRYCFCGKFVALFSFKPTGRQWNGIKHIFCYLQRTIDLGLFYSKETTSSGLARYTDAAYKSDLHKAHSQTSYLFCYNGTDKS